MTPDRGIELVGAWPADKTIPRKLAEGIKKTSGDDRRKLRSLIEALYAAAEGPADLELIQKHFD